MLTTTTTTRQLRPFTQSFKSFNEIIAYKKYYKGSAWNFRHELNYPQQKELDTILTRGVLHSSVDFCLHPCTILNSRVQIPSKLSKLFPLIGKFCSVLWKRQNKQKEAHLKNHLTGRISNWRLMYILAKRQLNFHHITLRIIFPVKAVFTFKRAQYCHTVHLPKKVEHSYFSTTVLFFQALKLYCICLPLTT